MGLGEVLTPEPGPSRRRILGVFADANAVSLSCWNPKEHQPLSRQPGQTNDKGFPCPRELIWSPDRIELSTIRPTVLYAERMRHTLSLRKCATKVTGCVSV